MSDWLASVVQVAEDLPFLWRTFAPPHVVTVPGAGRAAGRRWGALSEVMIPTEGGAATTLLIGYRVPRPIRLGSVLVLAVAIGANATLALQPTDLMTDTGITQVINYMLLGAVLVLAWHYEHAHQHRPDPSDQE